MTSPRDAEERDAKERDAKERDAKERDAKERDTEAQTGSAMPEAQSRSRDAGAAVPMVRNWKP